MTQRIIALDTTPLGLATKRVGDPAGDACRAWIDSLYLAGHRIIVPEISDYEVRRELARSGQLKGIQRLDSFLYAEPGRYLPITTDAMRLAAGLWAQVRNAGLPTADIHAIDGDVILAAQITAAGFPAGQFVIATSNVRHLSRLAPADVWTNIHL